MKTLCLDTHTWVWFTQLDDKLSRKTRLLIENSDRAFVSVVSIYEIGQKIRLGKWPEMDETKLDLMIEDKVSDITLLPVTPEIARHASLMDWPHRDPFDRLIAATALSHGAGLASRDLAFDGLDGVNRIWE